MAAHHGIMLKSDKDMHDIISKLMLTVDEVWLTHAEGLRFTGGISPGGVRLENTLVVVEAQLLAASDLIRQHQRGTSKRAAGVVLS